MASIFISYNRDNEPTVKRLAEDIAGLGHSVWLDHELSGGQAWWDQILKMIRSADIFVLALSPQALQSTACKSEFHYADQLGKTILPIKISDAISENLLPSTISKLQIIDYREQGREEILSLGRALTNISVANPMPDPLPPPPTVPLSYLGGLKEKVGAEEILDYEAQSALLLDLKGAFRNSETRNDARTLLKELKCRRDLLANVSEEIDHFLSTEVKISDLGNINALHIKNDTIVGPVSGVDKENLDLVEKETEKTQTLSVKAPLKIHWKTASILLGIAAMLSFSIIFWSIESPPTAQNFPPIQGPAGNIDKPLTENMYKKHFQVAYNGQDGVNLRSSSGGAKLATIFNQEIMILSLSDRAKYVGGNPWIKVKISGWMVKQSKSHQYITLRGENAGIVSWDGDGNENDNFITMRVNPKLNSKRIAHVYTNTQISILTKKNIQGREWINITLDGWMALESKRGLQLLRQIN